VPYRRKNRQTLRKLFRSHQKRSRFHAIRNTHMHRPRKGAEKGRPQNWPKPSAAASGKQRRAPFPQIGAFPRSFSRVSDTPEADMPRRDRKPDDSHSSPDRFPIPKTSPEPKARDPTLHPGPMDLSADFPDPLRSFRSSLLYRERMRTLESRR